MGWKLVLWTFLLLFPYYLIDQVECIDFRSKCTENDLSNKKSQVIAWLIDARFIAYCIKQHGSLDQNSIWQCSSKSCQECLKPCSKGNFRDRVTCNKTVCSESNSSVCEEACAFYTNSYNIQNDTDESQSPSLLPSPPTKSDFATSDKLELTWPSQGANVTVYALFRYSGSKFNPLLLTTHHKANITSAGACGSDPFDYLLETKTFLFTVVPVNQFGWRGNFMTAQRSSPLQFLRAKSVEDFKLIVPPTYSAGDLGFAVLNLKTTWKRSASHGVTSYYQSESKLAALCSKPGAVPNPSKTESFTGHNFKLQNRDDYWSNCNFTLEVTPVVNCIKGIPAHLFYNYEGCQTVKGYPISQCDALIPTVGPMAVEYKLELNENCTERLYYNCSIPGFVDRQTCWNCTTYSAALSLLWSVETKFLPQVIDYQYILSKWRSLGTFSTYFTIKTGRTGRETTSASFLVNAPGKYRFQVRPALNGTRDLRPQSMLPGKDFELKLPVKVFTTTMPTTTKPTKITTPDDGEVSSVTVAMSVMLIVVFCLGVALFTVWYTRKRRRELFMDTESATVRMAKFKPPDSWELHPLCIKLGSVIGEGAFGKVHLATIQESNVLIDDSKMLYVKSVYDKPEERKGVSYEAAVKLLRGSACSQERADFLAEIQLMKEIGYHKNVLCMTGCCTINEPLCLVTEYMAYGDLLHFLRNRRWQMNGKGVSYSEYLLSGYSDSRVERSDSCLFKGSDELTLTDYSSSKARTSDESGYRSTVLDPLMDQLLPEDVLSFSWQISAGMEYLEEKGVVHRDLAARNVLVGTGKTCKVADFGLARDIAAEQVYLSRKSRKLPIKWMSLEAILCQEFTTKSDVWAFGVVLFEIATLGGTPYPAIDNQTLLHELRHGYRMEQPENCADELYDIMQECWKEDPDKRPSFRDLRETLEQLISKGTPYVSFDLNESHPYYNVPSFRSLETDQVSLSDFNIAEDQCDTQKEDGDLTQMNNDKRPLTKSDPCALPGVENQGFERYVNSLQPMQHPLELSL